MPSPAETINLHLIHSDLLDFETLQRTAGSAILGNHARTCRLPQHIRALLAALEPDTIRPNPGKEEPC